MADEPFLFREIFNRKRIEFIGSQVATAWKGFDQEGFLTESCTGIDSLSYGDRAKKIRDALAAYLPERFEDAVSILVKSLGPEPEEDAIKGYEGFYVMPLTMFVSSYGMDEPDLALHALYEMTKRFTAEGDIRPFLIRYPEKTLTFLTDLTRDPSPFARRLASEGTRPRLPLSPRLPTFQSDPAPVIALLDRLYDDENLMVRRSVANNLNDIAKDNPEIVVTTLRRWHDAPDAADEKLGWLSRHALRTLVKQDHQGALKLLGYDSTGISATEREIAPRSLSLGQSLSFAVSFESAVKEPRKLALNYVIAFRKANGANKDKVFRMPDKTIAAGGSLRLEKTHHFKPFKNQNFYGGTHYIEVRMNGTSIFREPFELEVPNE